MTEPDTTARLEAAADAVEATSDELLGMLEGAVLLAQTAIDGLAGDARG